MNAYEYLNELRAALEVLPEDERANAIRYYEDYFLDAGPENEAKVIEELGTPQAISRKILESYTEIARTAPRPGKDPNPPKGAFSQAEEGTFYQAEEAEEPPRGFQKSGSFVPPKHSALLTFLGICAAVFFGVSIGIPLLAGAASAVLGLLVGLAVLLVGLVILLAGVLFVLPLGGLLCGGLLCIFSLFLWGMPASAMVTLGAGLCLLALGAMLAVGSLKLCSVSFRPLLHGIGWCIEQCGKFLRWCGDVVRRFLNHLKGM